MVLSQAEIDALLSAMSSGELDTEQIQQKDEKKVKNYDFSSPTKFSKEHLRTLRAQLHDYRPVQGSEIDYPHDNRAG